MVQRKLGLHKFIFLLFLCAYSRVRADSGEIYEIQLRWQPVHRAVHYKIQIGSDPGFHSLIEEGKSSEAAWIWHYNPEMGGPKSQIYYRIASVNEKGEVGTYSIPQSLMLPSFENQKEVHSSLRWGGSFNAGMGGFRQTSADTSLKSVSSESMTFQQKASLHLDLYQSLRLTSPGGSLLEERPFEPRWSLYFEFQYAAFSKVQNPRAFNQPNVTTYGLDVDLLHWIRSDSNSMWKWAYGLTLNRSFRWFKTGPEAVDSQGAFSVGPATYLIWLTPNPKTFLPAEFGVSLGVPATGVLTGGQIGGELESWMEWRLFRVSGTRFGLRFEGNVDYLQWQTPSQTSMWTWTFWGALSYHVGS